MAYVESHQSLGRHPKTRRLAHSLDIPVVQAVGHLQFLWWWALAYAADGDLSEVEPWIVAEAAMWEGDATVFTVALMDAGFLDPDLRLHDWHRYNGKRVERGRTKALRAAVIARDGLVCGICGEPVDPADVQVDHIIPIVAGGRTEMANLRVTHARCNRQKGAR